MNMRMFNHKTLAIAIASVGAIGTANAAGLDRSGQDVTAFLQDGTYAEAVYTYVDADVSGKDVSGNVVGDIAEKYDFFRYGVKADINDRFSVGVLYDEPFGAAVQYEGANNFVADQGATTTSMINTAVAALKQQNPALGTAVEGLAGQITSPTIARLATQNPRLAALGPAADNVKQTLNAIADTAEAVHGQGTNVEIRTQNVTMLLGAKFGQNKNFQIYGGPAAQRLTGEVHLRGLSYGPLNGYDAKIATDQAAGWVAGVSYSKPEIALKAALTYRSEIDHNTKIAEVLPARALRNLDPQTSEDFSVTLPESWNLDFQTGINPTTLLTAKVRYVPWSDFDIRPTTYTKSTQLPIISYDKDQWSAELGLGKKLSDKVSVAGNIGYDSGAGNPASTLGPIKGYYSAGLGVKYNVTPEWSVSLGGKYLKFGDATAQLPTKATVGKFEDNDGFIAGLKIAYHAK